MERSGSAFCPGHISGYFRPVTGKTPAETGSLGAGIVIHEGVEACVSYADETMVTVLQLGADDTVIARLDSSPPITWLLDRMGVQAAVLTRCHLPISAGFGLSAAALIATALAAGALLPEPPGLMACAALAHEAEIVHKTGLGDVAAAIGGGRDCRLSPGVGGKIRRWHDVTEPLYAVTLSSLDSPSVLSSRDRLDAVMRAWPGKCPDTVHELFTLSRAFARDSGLILPEVGEVLCECDRTGVLASMTMLGNGIFAYGQRAREVLTEYGHVYELQAAEQGPRILNRGRP